MSLESTTGMSIRPSGALSQKAQAFLAIESAVRRFTRNMRGVIVGTDRWEFGVLWTVYAGDNPMVNRSVRVLCSDFGLTVLVKVANHYEPGPQLTYQAPADAAFLFVAWLDKELP